MPGDPIERYGGEDIVQALEDRGVEFARLSINPSDVTTESWCESFGTSINEPMGIALQKAIIRLKKNDDYYVISDLIDEIKKNTRSNEKTIDALVNRLEMASQWGLFAEDKYEDFSEILPLRKINVLDLSVLDFGTLWPERFNTVSTNKRPISEEKCPKKTGRIRVSTREAQIVVTN